MRKVFGLIWSLALLLVFFGNYSYSGTPQEKSGSSRVKMEESFGKLPLSFIENRGQANETVAYYLEGRQGTIYFTREGIVYDLIAGKDSVMKTTVRKKTEAPSKKLSRLSFSIKPKGARKDVKITAEESLPGRVNYLTGNDPDKWRMNIPIYESIVYKGLYQGIDLKLYGTNNQMEYDFIVHPEGNPKDIELSCEGIKELEIDRDGNLLIKTLLTDVKHLKPVIYQEIDGKRRPVEGSFRVVKNSFAFEVKEYDKNYPLIIDPLTLSYSTYLGGSGYYDWGFGIAVDSSGNSYVTGAATGHDFPLENAYQEMWIGGTEVFVTKLNSSGTGLFYSTFLGGRENDYGYGIAVDSSGNAYVTGKTFSDDFPVENPYQETYGGGNTDAFVTKLNANGWLSYSTYLGGSNYDSGQGIAVESSGKCCVIGETRSTDFPVQDAYQETFGGFTDAFVTKLDPYGSGLSYSTYLGGSSPDYGHGIAVDPSGNCYVTGEAESSDFPLQNAYQETYRGNGDAFVTKLNPAGSALRYSTYLGGSGADVGRGIAVDSSGNAYVTGETSSATHFTYPFPIKNAYQGTSGGSYDAFVSKLNPSGTGLSYSTYLGGSSGDYGYGIAVDPSGNCYVTGETNSADDFPLENAYQETYGGSGDAFVTMLNPAGNGLFYSTYIGGSSTSGDQGEGIAVDSLGNTFVAGGTASIDFPVQNAYQGTYGGSYDAFVVKIASGQALPLNPTGTSTNLTGIPHVNVPVTLTLAATGTGTFYYRFFIGSNYGAPWTQVQPWSTNGSCTHTPTSEGNNVFLAHMSDDPSSGNFHQAGFSFATSGHSEAGVVIYGLTTNLSMPQTVGTPINLTAQAYGTGTIYYKFWYKDDTGWHVIQDWSQNNMTTWTPPQAGTHTVVVWANTTPNDNTPNRPIAGFTFTVGG